MRVPVQRTKFRKDYKRQLRRGKNLEKLDGIVALLIRDGVLQSSHRPHKLSGEYAGLWESHIEPDWPLIYRVTDEEVILARTGTHSDLFGK